MTQPASTPSDVVRAFLEAQNRCDAAACSSLVHDDAVFDVGRGTYAGKASIEEFLAMLFRLHTQGSELSLADDANGHVEARWTNADDDLRRMGIGAIGLEGTFSVREGRIAGLRARPTAQSLQKLREAGQGGATSGGLTLAEAAGTLDVP